MKYYRALTEGARAQGPIRVTFLLRDDYHIAYRSKTQGDLYSCRFTAVPTTLPGRRDYGEIQEITEAEAMALDPEMFEDGKIWENYQQFLPYDRQWEEEKRGKKR